MSYAVLVFGTTPLAHRIAFYLQGYAQSREIPIVVHRTKPEGMEGVQQKVWSSYVSASHEGRPNVVINASELNELDLCETNPERAWTENTRDAAHIAYAARTADIPLIHISTDHVFRGENGPYPDSKEPVNPLNVYGTTKWYAEKVVEKVHPFRQSDPSEEKGTRIIRTSDLYGFDTNTWPSRLTPGGDSVKESGTLTTVTTGGVIRDGTRTTPSFIGEVAFLIARNILHNTGFGQPIAHVAPDIQGTTWGDYLHQLGQKVIYQEMQARGEVRIGASRGLKPSDGWYLPGNTTKSYTEFLDEYKTQSYTLYWQE